MHQLLCGVKETLFVDGYRIEVLEVTDDVVRIGLSTHGCPRTVHEVRLPAAETSPLTSIRYEAADRPAVN